MKVKKVLFIARRFPPSLGGMENFAYDLSETLGTKVELIMITWGGSNKWLPIVLPSFFFRACYQLIKNRDIDIIHMQDALQAPIGWLLSVIFRKPFTVVAHGLDITYLNKFYQMTVIPFVRKANAVISICTSTKQEVIKRGGVKERQFMITPGMKDYYGKVVKDREKFSKLVGRDLKDRVVLLTAGRLVKRKGGAWFTKEVLPMLAKTNPEVLYVVVGDGPERVFMEESIKKFKLENNIVMLGVISHEDRSLAYQSSDIFVMPSVYVPGHLEGFGMVMLEGSVAELPVVAVKIEGTADAIKEGVSGVFVEPGDSKGFAREVVKLVENKDYRVSLGKKGRKYTLREYNYDKLTDKYLDVYKYVLENKK